MTSESESTNYQPDEVWEYRNLDIEQSIFDAIETMNSLNYEQLLARLHDEVKFDANTGVRYAHLDGENSNEYSNTDAIVLFNPYASGATDQMLVRAEFIRMVAKNEGVTDKNGDFLPVVLMANPGRNGSKFRISDTQRERVKAGDFEPIAEKYMRTVELHKFGRVALLGFSQGSHMAMSSVEPARSTGLDVIALGAGDPPTVEDRDYRSITEDLATSIPGFFSAYRAGNIKAHKKSSGLLYARELFNFGGSYTNKMNRDLAHGLANDVFFETFMKSAEFIPKDKLVVGYGDSSHITRKNKIEYTLNMIDDLFGERVYSSIEVKGAGHTWGDNLPALLHFYLRALR